MNEESKSFSELGKLIDSTKDEFSKYCSGKSLGELVSIQKILALTFNEMTLQRENMVASIKGMTEEEKKEKDAITTYLLFHNKMLQVEQHYLKLMEIIKVRQTLSPKTE